MIQDIDNISSAYDIEPSYVTFSHITLALVTLRLRLFHQSFLLSEILLELFLPVRSHRQMTRTDRFFVFSFRSNLRFRSIGHLSSWQLVLTQAIIPYRIAPILIYVKKLTSLKLIVRTM